MQSRLDRRAHASAGATKAGKHAPSSGLVTTPSTGMELSFLRRNRSRKAPVAMPAPYTRYLQGTGGEKGERGEGRGGS